MNKIDEVYEVFKRLCSKDYSENIKARGFSAVEFSKIINTQRNAYEEN